MNPIVSVIIPTYNCGKYLKDAIESVRRQTYRHLEIIVIDNYSTDDTTDIMKLYANEENINYYKFNNKGIIASARNYGVEKSKGELIAFLDADDLWEPNKLEVQIEYLTNEVCAVSSNYIPIGNSEQCYNNVSKLLRNSEYIDLPRKKLLISSPIVTSSVLMRRADFIKISGFNESKKYAFIEDWEFWLRLSANYPMRVINTSLVRYRITNKIGRDQLDIYFRCLELLKSQNGGSVNRLSISMAKSKVYADIAKSSLGFDNLTCIRYCLKSLFSLSSLFTKCRVVCIMFSFLLPYRFCNNFSIFLKRMRR